MSLRLPILVFVLIPVALACSSTTTTTSAPPEGVDASTDEDAGEDPPVDPPADAATDTSAVRDAGHDSGKLPFGETCTADAQCDSNVCAPNDTGGPYWCSYRCTKTTQAMKCPTPETPGTCNTHGYCHNF